MMVKKVGELSWLERMMKEHENDPEYLREYIALCSDTIKHLEQRVKELEETNLNNVAMADYQIAELKAENALLRKRLEPIETAYKEYEEYPLSAIVKRDAYNQAINRCMSSKLNHVKDKGGAL